MAERAAAGGRERTVPPVILELPLALPQARPGTFVDGHHCVGRLCADAALAGSEAGHPRAQQVGSQNPR